MARIDRVRESYEAVTEQLFGDKTAFEQYLKFAGKFFKLPSEQAMMIYGTNPKATMVADFGTWKKFSRFVQRGANSIAVLDNGSLKHYFDIAQTAGSKTPYQWTLDKDTANHPEVIPSLKGRLKWELIPRQIDKEAREYRTLLKKQYVQKNPRPTTFVEIRKWENTLGMILDRAVIEDIVHQYRE